MAQSELELGNNGMLVYRIIESKDKKIFENIKYSLVNSVNFGARLIVYFLDFSKKHNVFKLLSNYSPFQLSLHVYYDYTYRLVKPTLRIILF